MLYSNNTKICKKIIIYLRMIIAQITQKRTTKRATKAERAKVRKAPLEAAAVVLVLPVVAAVGRGQEKVQAPPQVAQIPSAPNL